MLQLLGIKDATSGFTVRPILPKQQSLAQKTGRLVGEESQGVAHLLQESEVRLSDIGGYHHVKGEIQKLIRLFNNQEHYESFGVRPPRGILFVGPPGTGKTTFAKAMCNELNINFYYVSTSDVLNCYYGESEKRIAKIFEEVKTPCVIFVDELEALAANRENLSEPSKRVVTELLKKLEGMGSRSDILFLGATNKPDMLDPAITRSGRLDKTIVVGYPDEEARKETFEVYVRKYLELNKSELDCLRQLDTAKLARASQEFVGGDIKELMRRVVFSIADSALPDTTGTANKPTWQPTTEGVMSLIDQYQAELALKRGS
jgi:transitional endoplasmic reticulum ATPase